ncbi:hypothetical protein G6F61_014286 [Rhizopus arrhizus]|nr:hypothetical protein G6F61_014286 [Rhizopus arrhizus]
MATTSSTMKLPSRPHGARQGRRQHHAAEQHRDRQVEAGAVMQAADGDGRQRPKRQLAFGADVVEAGAERHGTGQARQHQRSGAGQRFGQGEARAERAFEQQRVGTAHGGAGPGHQQGADRQLSCE